MVGRLDTKSEGGLTWDRMPVYHSDFNVDTESQSIIIPLIGFIIELMRVGILEYMDKKELPGYQLTSDNPFISWAAGSGVSGGEKTLKYATHVCV